MAILDMFDKLDDIVYEPIKYICDFLRSRDNLEAEQKKADIEIKMANSKIELEIKRRKLNTEIDNMIADNEFKRNKAIVEATKQYQIDLSQAVNECINQIGIMSLELRNKANNLVIEKTKEYTALQDKSKANAIKELKEIEEMFASNEKVKNKLEDAVIDQMTDMINTAKKFINELSDDIKRLNENIDELAKHGQDIVEKHLSPMATKKISEEYKKIEQK